jgi:adenine-specific DNA-methyltransferase
LKHLGEKPYADGVHRVDAMVYRPLELGLPQVIEDVPSQIWCGDAYDLIAQCEVDILYLDPPYNGRQYIDNYHVLENIARWEHPALKGKTRKFDRSHLKSRFSRKRTASQGLAALIQGARCRYMMLSYNNEGIIPDEAIHAALQRRGPVAVFEREYSIFGNGAGRSRRRPILERLFTCKVIQ